jgi:hypothetical protein
MTLGKRRQRYAALCQRHLDRFRAGSNTVAVRSYSREWIDARRARVHSVADEDTRLRLHVLPHNRGSPSRAARHGASRCTQR